MFAFVLFLMGGTQPGQEPDLLGMMLPMVLIFAVFYFLIIRPQNKKEKEKKDMVAGVKKGDGVVTIGGIHGKVTKVDEGTVHVQVAENVRLRVDKVAIAGVEPKG